VTSTPATLTISSAVATLKHRYSFGETSGSQAKDSVGTAHAELLGNATLGGGSVALDGSDGSYVNLPNGVISALGEDATIEMWITSTAVGPAWARVFDFGTSTGGEDVSDGGADVDTLFLTAKTPQGFPRFEANFPGGGTLTGLNHPGSLPVDTQEHVVIAYSFSQNVARMYVNGVVAVAGTAPKKISDFAGRDVNNWLGRSQYPDPYWTGKYNEVRLYSGAMAPSQVASSYSAGPDKLPSAAAPTVAIARDGANLKVTYTGTLQSAPVVTGPWADVAGATSPYSVSPSAASSYFRGRQ